ALVAPASLAQNARVEGEVVVEKVKESEWEFGYNAMTDKLQVLTTQAIVVEKAQPKTTAAAGAQQGGFSV
ncbi:RuBisCO large subunit-binding protein subunit alpha, partial [Tanacetum coccineum]